MYRRPPRSTRIDTLFPYTTLFLSIRRRRRTRRRSPQLAEDAVADLEVEFLLEAHVGRGLREDRAVARLVGGCRAAGPVLRSEERRVGKEGVSKCRSRWSPDHKKKTRKTSRQHKNKTMNNTVH